MPVDSKTWQGPIKSIQLRICAEFELSIIEMISARRDRRFIPARHIAMWMCRKLTTASLPAIGIAFGNRDHSTIVHGIQNADRIMQTDSAMKARIDNILKEWHDGK